MKGITLLLSFAALTLAQDVNHLSRDEAKATLISESVASSRGAFADALRASNAEALTASNDLAKLEGKSSIATKKASILLSKTEYTNLMAQANSDHAKAVQALKDMIADLKLSAPPSLTAKIDSLKQKIASEVEDSVFKPEEEFTAEVMQDSVDTVEEANEEANNIKKLHIWRGYCSKPAGDNWNEYCLDTVEEDTGKPYFEVDTDTNTRFKALKSGYFRINLRYISNSCNWGHVIVYFGNTYRYHGHNNDRGNWQDKSADLTYWANAGEVFYVRTYAACGDRNSYFSGGEDGKHSRMEVMYMGAKP
eukprot:m.57151 g.57151  ORF g.57151 m.57151 type:complete len:307 (+) comp11084_c0_seq1:48-968(+)